jgi:hypothetical protein
MSETLLLDEHFSADIAVALRDRGYPCHCVNEDDDLRGKPDDHIAIVATGRGWRIVTENVRDFLPLSADARMAGKSEPLLLLIGSRHAPRGARRTGLMVDALSRWLDDPATRGSQEWLVWE